MLAFILCSVLTPAVIEQIPRPMQWVFRHSASSTAVASAYEPCVSRGACQSSCQTAVCGSSTYNSITADVAQEKPGDLR
jgi:hypothetical protein